MSVTETSITQNAIADNDINQLIDSIACIVEEDRMVGLMLGIATSDSVLFSGGFGSSILVFILKVFDIYFGGVSKYH